ncbi:hypothetical protein [Flavobacterium sp. U410]|jgi:hypothetical protein
MKRKFFLEKNDLGKIEESLPNITNSTLKSNALLVSKVGGTGWISTWGESWGEVFGRSIVVIEPSLP